MPACSLELDKVGQPYPRTCALCGLGPCQRKPGHTQYVDANTLAIRIASNVHSLATDRQRRDELTVLLAAFAAEVRRSVIEP